MEKIQLCPKCHSPRLTEHVKLWANETRFTPAEYVFRFECKDCGHWFDPSDAEEMEVEECGE